MAGASAGSLSGIGTLYAWEFDDENGTNFSISGSSTAYASEFDENTSTTLTSTQRMRVTSSPTGNVIVYDSINEIDPFGEIPTDGLQLHLDSVDSSITSTTGSGGSLSISNLANITDTGSANVSSTSIDCSTVTSSDLYVVTYQAEASSGDTFTCDINGTTASVAISNSNTSGNSRVGIFYVEGSVVAGDSTTSTSISSSNGGFRGSFQAFRLVNGSGATVADTDVSESSGQSSQTNTVNFSSGMLFTTGFYPNDQGHSFTGGTSTEYDGVQNGNGSGDGAINTTSTTSSHTVTYTHGGSTNTQGEALATAVFTGGSTTIYYWEDISGNNRDATFSGVSGNPKVGNFIDFDGTDDYSATDGTGSGASAYTGVTGTGARTSILFLKIDAPDINYKPLAWGDTNTGQKWTMAVNSSNLARGEIAGAAVEQPSGHSVDMTDGNWHMMAVSAPASGTAADIQMWLDGIEVTGLTVTNGTTSINTASTNYVSVGGALADASPLPLDGQIAKALVYNRQLSDLEIKIIYRSILNRLL